MNPNQFFTAVGALKLNWGAAAPLSQRSAWKPGEMPAWPE